MDYTEWRLRSEVKDKMNDLSVFDITFEIWVPLEKITVQELNQLVKDYSVKYPNRNFWIEYR